MITFTRVHDGSVQGLTCDIYTHFVGKEFAALLQKTHTRTKKGATNVTVATYVMGYPHFLRCAKRLRLCIQAEDGHFEGVV